MTPEDHGAFAEILQLLVPARHPADIPIVGASPVALENLATLFGRPLPTDAATWLGVCNGSLAGEGGTLSVAQIAEELEFWPKLSQLGWLPVASDGCGNRYVVDTNSPSGAVGFFEPMASADEIQYYLASSLPIFLQRWLEQEALEQRRSPDAGDPSRTPWPFDPHAALQTDPELESFSPLPWNA